MAAPRTPGDPASTAPAWHGLRRPSFPRSLQGKLPGACGAGAVGLTPDRGAARPGLGSFGAQRGPSLLRRSPGAGQGRAGRIERPPARHSPRPPRASARPPSRGRERAGAARAGPLAAARARGGRARAPRVPGVRANGRPAFGKIAIYGHVLGPRAPPPARAARSRLNSGGGGRGRSHTPPPAYSAFLSAAPSPVLRR